MHWFRSRVGGRTDDVIEWTLVVMDSPGLALGSILGSVSGELDQT